MLDKVEKQNIRIGKFIATNKNTIINLYYTPTVLTTNSLVFNKKDMSLWWEQGFTYAKIKNKQLNETKVAESSE